MARLASLLLLLQFPLLIFAPDADQVSANSPAWSHSGSTGPDKWCQIGYPTCCTSSNSSQSPIEISTWFKIKTVNENIVYKGYDSPVITMQIINNGHTAEITLETTQRDRPQISSGPLKNGEVYYLDNIHFHWGSNGLDGSEHTIDWRRYAMEMHLVHYNSKYKDAMEAGNNPDGLAVLTVLFQEGLFKNVNYNALVSYLPNITYRYQTANITKLTLSSLLPSKTSKYYTYKGSLTTPPCSESVTWLILDQTVRIGFQQLKMFRTLREKEEGAADNPILQNNIRPLQPLNNRVIDMWDSWLLG